MFKSVLSASAVLLCGSHVSAAPLQLEDIFGTFAAVTQSYSGNSESEGRVIIAGDATGNILINDRDAGTAADGFDDLIITGNASNANITVGNSGSVTIGGDLTNSNLQLNGGVQTATLGGTRSGGNFNQNEDILIENAANPNIPDVDFDVLEQESDRLSSLGGTNALTTNASGQVVFGGASVLDIDFSVLNSGTAVFDLTGIDTLLINVTGASGSIGLNFVDYLGVSKLDAAANVIWNFFDADGVIDFNATVVGHILAPEATINLNSSNEGSIIASSLFSNNGELHPLAFNGTVPGTEDMTVVPLPAGGLLLLSGVAGLMVLRRRKSMNA